MKKKRKLTRKLTAFLLADGIFNFECETALNGGFIVNGHGLVPLLFWFYRKVRSVR